MENKLGKSKYEEDLDKYAEMQAESFIKSLEEKYKKQKIDVLEESYTILQKHNLNDLKEKTSIIKSINKDFNDNTDYMIQTLFNFVVSHKNDINKDIFVDIGKLLVKTKEDCRKWSIFICGGKAYLNSENKYVIDNSYWTSKNMDLPLERLNKMLDEHNIILENRANVNRPFYVDLWGLKKN